MADVQIRGRTLASHAGAFVAGAVLSTAIVSQALPNSRASADRYAALDVFAQSLSYIANSYVEPVDERRLIHGAVQGMVKSLDAHSAFLPPDRYERLRQDTEGEFGSVGITLGGGPAAGKGPDYPVVETVIPGSPASRAGIAVGDRVVAIDGTPTAGPGIKTKAHAWSSKLRGLSGTRVELRLERSSWPSPRTFELVRERVKVPTVESFTVEPGIGYIAVSKFHEATAVDMTMALETLDRNGLEALILDLRGNPGGLLDQAIRVADLFLEQGTIVTIRGRRESQTEREVAHGPGTWTKVRLLVLIDQGSASSAEIVAGALQDHGRATIMGLPSYGKGSVQTFIDLKDGSGLKLTTARYYTPTGRTLEGAGITPDIHVEAFAEEVITAGPENPDSQTSEARAEGNSPPPGSSTIPERLVDDHQFEVAYQTVKKWLGAKK